MDEKVLKSSICSVSLVTKIRIIQYNSYIYKYYLGYHKATMSKVTGHGFLLRLPQFFGYILLPRGTQFCAASKMFLRRRCFPSVWWSFTHLRGGRYLL